MDAPTKRAQPPDPLQTWREWLTETERQFNAFFQDVLGNDRMAGALGQAMQLQIGMQKMWAEGAEQFLRMWSIPTRADVDRVESRLESVEQRLTNIEALLQSVANRDGVNSAAHVTEPRRTRVVPGAALENSQ